MSEHNAERINKVGRKIRAVRDLGGLRGEAFLAWRSQIYEQGSDDDREAFVDAKMRDLGLKPEDYDAQ